MRDALMPGSELEPAALVRRAAELNDPVGALCRHDGASDLFDAFDQDFGFIRSAKTPKNQFSEEDRNRAASLLRWLIAELQRWSKAADPHGGKLAALFVVSQRCDSGGSLWRVIPDAIGTNLDLVHDLKAMISRIGFTITSKGGARPSIWENEAVERLQLVEANREWGNLSEAWRPFEQMFQPVPLHTQAVRCLYRCGVTHLVEASSGVKQTAVAASLAIALPAEERLQFAVKCENPYIEFCCLHQTLSDLRTPDHALSIPEERLVVDLLCKAASDYSKWSGWMQAFNAYPQRNPGFQTALGTALATVSDAAVKAYIVSIMLYPRNSQTDESRKLVGVCLRTFHSKASLARRKSLWSLAHARWTDWAFNRSDPGHYLFEINWSELDYAIVGYALECLGAEDRWSAVQSAFDDLMALENRWHKSISDITSEWYRILSTFQPYGHAETVLDSCEDWLSEAHHYWPVDQTQIEHIMVKYSRGH